MFLGWFVLFPPEFSQLGKHVAGGAGFVSNFILWGETGYFDSKNKLLLHLWSLGVEEQFYIVWPLFLVLAWKKRWNMTAAILGIAVASFAMSVWMVGYSDRTFAFYSPTTRLWELLAGALLSWKEIRHATATRSIPRYVTESSSAIGLAAIAITVSLVNQDMAWPGWLALLPVAGVLLVIGPGSGSFLNQRLLGNRVLVGVGLISYPLYLWHWPLLVLGRLVNEAQLPRTGRVGIVLISFLLAWVTYKFVEKPIRFGTHKRRSAAILLPLMASVGLVGFFLANGVPKPRLIAAYKAIITSRDKLPRGSNFNRSGTDIVTPTIPGDSTRVVALVGDSHATQYWPRFEEIINTKADGRPSVVLMAYGGCAPLNLVNHRGVSWDGMPFRCPLFHKKTWDRIRQTNVATVVYSACWECFFNARQLYFVSDPEEKIIPRSGPGIDLVFSSFESDVRRLIEAGKKVYIVLPNPDSPLNSPNAMLPRRLPGLAAKPFKRFASLASIDSVNGFARDRLLKVAARTGATVIDPMAATCTPQGCPTVSPEGKAIYSDDHHFRPEYVRSHATFIDVVLDEKALSRNGRIPQ